MGEKKNQNIDDRISGDESRKFFEDMLEDYAKHDNYKLHLLTALKDSNQVREEVKTIVWQSLKDKIVWMVFSGIVFLLVVFAKEYIGQIAQNAANR